MYVYLSGSVSVFQLSQCVYYIIFFHFQKLTVLVGEPIDFTSLIRTHYQHYHTNLHVNAIELRRQITNVIQEKMYELKTSAETLHKDWNVRSPVAYRAL